MYTLLKHLFLVLLEDLSRIKPCEAELVLILVGKSSLIYSVDESSRDKRMRISERVERMIYSLFFMDHPAGNYPIAYECLPSFHQDPGSAFFPLEFLPRA